MNGRVTAVTGRAPGFVKALREARVAQGRTQEDLAAELGWGRTRMHECEAGIRAIAPVQLDRWAAALGLRIAAIPAGDADGGEAP